MTRKTNPVGPTCTHVYPSGYTHSVNQHTLTKTQAGHVPFGDEGLRAAWRSCFSMVMTGKCSAVC